MSRSFLIIVKHQMKGSTSALMKVLYLSFFSARPHHESREYLMAV